MTKEKYQPTEEEMKKAEGMAMDEEYGIAREIMTPEQKHASTTRIAEDIYQKKFVAYYGEEGFSSLEEEIEKLKSPEGAMGGTLFWRSEPDGKQESEHLFGKIDEIIYELRTNGYPEAAFRGMFGSSLVKIDLIDPTTGEIAVGTDDLEVAARVVKLMSSDKKIELWRPGGVRELFDAIDPNFGDEKDKELYRAAVDRSSKRFLEMATTFGENKGIL